MSDFDKWPLIYNYFRNKTFADLEIQSFNQFVDEKLPEIVIENQDISPKIEEVRVEVANIEILRPRVVEADGSPRNDFWPIEARIRNRTYSGPIYLDMRLLRRDVEQDVKRAYVGDLPIMLKSNMCWLNGKTPEELVEMGEDPLDFGGYFIINGSEKALMTQEVLSSDRVMISEKVRGDVIAEVISTRGAFKGRVRVMRKRNGLLYVRFPSSPKKLKLFVLMRALGMESEADIKAAFTLGEEQVQNDVLLNLEQTEITKEQDALDKIGKSVAPGQVIDYRLKRAREVVDGFLLPHIGQTKNDRIAKAYYLGMMASKAVERAYGLREEDDKDHYANKRLELSGKLMEHLFRYAFKYFVKDLKFQIDRTVTRRRKLNISTVVRPDAITERIRFAMSTGNWIGRATGVSKFMDRVNYLSPLTDIRKVKSPLNKNRELYEARDVHGTHWGRVDAVETPDGPQCGLVKNLALLARVTTDSHTDQIEAMLKEKGVKLE
jgi:DNA-directed RNA polymerase beta subunit